ncbi:hypothetical protein QYM36_013404, partial [Artemia franciscana]
MADWRGLADICGLRGCEIEQFDQRTNPAWQLLQRLLYDLSISKLLYHLEELDRYDIIEDSWEKIERCLQSYQRRLEDQKKYPKGEYQPVTSKDIAAFEAGLPLVTYDAFVLYADNSPVDSEFALNLRKRLENDALQICSRDDLLPGMHSEINALTGLIKNRCKTVIIIATNDLFHNSSVNTWLVNVTITIGFEQPKKIIPCRIDREVRIPESLAPISKLDFCNKNVDSYARLINSIHLLSKQAEKLKAREQIQELSPKSKTGRGSSRWLKELFLSRNSSSRLSLSSKDFGCEEENLIKDEKNKGTTSRNLEKENEIFSRELKESK